MELFEIFEPNTFIKRNNIRKKSIIETFNRCHAKNDWQEWKDLQLEIK